MLGEARRSLGIDIEKVAGRLNLGSDIIRAMESGNQALLPPRPFLQGHIRSYAKLVNLDLDVIMPLWQKECPPVEPEKVVPIESDKRIRRMHRRNRRSAKRRNKTGIFIGVFLIVAIIGFSLLSTAEKSTAPSEQLVSIASNPGQPSDANHIAIPLHVSSKHKHGA